MTHIKSKIARVAALVAPLALVPGIVQAQGYYMHDGMGWGGGWGHGFFGPLMMLALLAIVVGAIVLIVRWAGGTHGGDTRAKDILKERFARGEIDKAEFEDRRRLL